MLHTYSLTINNRDTLRCWQWCYSHLNTTTVKSWYPTGNRGHSQTINIANVQSRFPWLRVASINRIHAAHLNLSQGRRTTINEPKYVIIGHISSESWGCTWYERSPLLQLLITKTESTTTDIVGTTQDCCLTCKFNLNSYCKYIWK